MKSFIYSILVTISKWRKTKSLNIVTAFGLRLGRYLAFLSLFKFYFEILDSNELNSLFLCVFDRLCGSTQV